MCTHHDQHSSTQDTETRQMLERRRLVQALGAGGVIVAAPTLTSCATNPETGSRQLLLIGSSQLNQMAASSWAEAKKQTLDR